MTVGQQLREEGREEGRRQGECNVLLRMLRRRFGAAVDAAVEQRVMAAPLEQIGVWMDPVLSAATLHELLPVSQPGLADGG